MRTVTLQAVALTTLTSPHLHRDLAHARHIRAGLTPPHLRRDWFHCAVVRTAAALQEAQRSSSARCRWLAYRTMCATAPCTPDRAGWDMRATWDGSAAVECRRWSTTAAGCCRRGRPSS